MSFTFLFFHLGFFLGMFDSPVLLKIQWMKEIIMEMKKPFDSHAVIWTVLCCETAAAIFPAT